MYQLLASRKRSLKIPDPKETLAVFVIVLLVSSSGVIERWFPPLVEMDDPGLVAEIRERLVPPSSGPYNLRFPKRAEWGQSSQIRVIQALTRNKTGGVFLEAGAHDGESMSNTLLLERQFGWTGLLVEPSKTLYAILVSRKRRSPALQACLSQTGQPFTAVFRSQLIGGLGSMEDGMQSEKISNMLDNQYPSSVDGRYPVRCFPLYSILLAANMTNVDFFSLDIEGMEMGVLAYIPWDRVNIQILMVETYVGFFWNSQADQMRWLLQQHGYLAFRLQHDWLFVRRDSPYARDAAEIVPRLRRRIAELPGIATDPYNDGEQWLNEQRSV